MRFDPEGITNNPEIPFAKSMPDYIMRWLASRFIEDIDELEDLGILTQEVRARKEAQQSLFEEQKGGGNGHGNGNGHAAEAPADGGSGPATAPPPAPPPVIPARMSGSDLGPAC